MSAERLEAELPVHEYHGIAGFEEVLCGCRPTSSWGSYNEPDAQRGWGGMGFAYQH